MFVASLITFRESLEALLVVIIIITFLTKTNQHVFKRFVWRGVFIGVFVSIFLAIVLEVFFGGLQEGVEEIFEGTLMFITAGFLTWMILWVHRQKDVARKIKEKVALHAKEGYGIGIMFLTATAVFREGTETVLYLKASSLAGATNQLAGAVLGIVAALVFGFVLFRWMKSVSLSTAFNVTSLFLLLFAAGLVSHGVHEFQEAGLLPIFSFDPVFNISHILDNKSLVGSFLRTLFGYTSKPTVLEVFFYLSYLIFISWLKKLTDRVLTAKY